MRKSGQVLLTAIMLTAISAAKADAQTHEASDSTSSHHGGPYVGRDNYTPPGLFSRANNNNNNNNQGNSNQTNHPRGGFGNTLRSFFSGKS